MKSEILIEKVELITGDAKIGKELKTLTIYYNKEKTSMQVIRPNEKFNSDWYNLVMGITGGNHHSYDIN